MLWFCARPDASGAEVVSPTGRSQIVVPIAEGSSAPALAGIYTKPQPIDAADQRRACGAVFRIGHTGAFVPAPLSDFTNAQPTVDRSIWHGERSLKSRLAEAHNPERTLDELERTLLDALISDFTIDPAVAAATSMLDEGHRISDVVSSLGVDRRTFGPRFTRSVGVAPKQFSRTRRFRRAVRRIRDAGDVPLAELAIDLGYSDQAHMTRDFREFTGTTPRVAHGVASTSPGHFAA